MSKIIAFLLTLPVILTARDIYMAGDSTMAQYGGKYPPMKGWGMEMQKHCKTGVTVYNRAVGGRSSKSFITEKLWEKVMKEAKKGDFVIIQFGYHSASDGKEQGGVGIVFFGFESDSLFRNYVAESGFLVFGYGLFGQGLRGLLQCHRFGCQESGSFTVPCLYLYASSPIPGCKE